MFGDMGKMLKQVGEMKAKMSAVEKELQNMVVKTAAKDGSVEVELTGKMKLKSVKVLKDLDNSDKRKVESVLYEVFNAALTQVSDLAQKKLSAVTGGLKLPGL
ncbi:MAG: YbaB/EbfC family nucleoid-associated protein [Candidatus Margulisbacteria bacterium]|jgi:DNA-binding YbaB/EbfC family protein|nr:YbaB/EbfC family nucleoid-associated protein [Candidatus Margulisiibacteriota bacterium]